MLAINISSSVAAAPSAPVSHNSWMFKYNALFQEDPSLFPYFLFATIALSSIFIRLLIPSPWKIKAMIHSYKSQRLSDYTSTSSQSQLNYPDFEDIINDFLQEISFKSPILQVDQDLKGRVINRMKTQGVPQVSIEQVQRCIETAVTMTAYTYSFASATVQEAIATFAAYAISIDDLTRDFAVDLQAYATNLVLGQQQRHPLLQGFTTHLSEQCHIFGPFGGDMIIKGALEFISSASVEAEHNDNLHLPRDASDFLDFFRAKTGVAEPFAFFCFPEDTHLETKDLERYVAAVPAIMLFLDYVNDLLSFYKEHKNKKAGDSASFVVSHAKVHQISLVQSLQHVKEESVKVVRRVRSIRAGDPVLFGHLEEFIQGYVLFHLAFGRYKLAELNIPLAIEASKRFQLANKWPRGYTNDKDKAQE